LKIRWLRLGGPAIEPIEFARQAAELLREVHDRVGIVHLDLRLDNFLITPDGVGLVDFGSALRRGEDVTASAILTKLFTEMLSASQVRQDYLRMKNKGLITSSAFDDCYQPPGPGADLFSVVNNFARLQEHPDFVGLVKPNPAQDAELVRLRREVFKPANPRMPSVNKMGDLYRVLSGEASLEDSTIPLSALRARTVDTTAPSAGSSLDPAFADLSIDLPPGTQDQDADAPGKLPTGLF
jgi:serine/threonine protein kinase